MSLAAPRRAHFLCLLAVLLCGPAWALEAPPIAYQQRTLANGLLVFTSLNRSTPNVSVQVWYGVGAKNDPQGRSGFAHLFEHLMFKATRDMPPETIDRLTEDVGGTNNAFTGDDTTAYYETVPANHLERLIWAEAERMGSLVVDPANFASEREVVKEELRQRVLADPYGAFNLLIPEESFTVHPYKRPPIGSIAELDAATLDDVRAFHAAYYRPDDAALIVVGNFDQARLDAWIDRYFGTLKTPAGPMPQVTAVEPPRAGPRTVVAHGPNAPLPAVAITWLAPAANAPDAPALEVLEALLATGKASRLYQSLVHDQQIAQEVSASADLRAQAGLIYVTAVMAGGRTAEAGAAALSAQVAALRAGLVSPAELDRAKAQLLSGALRRRETDEGRGFELGQALRVEGDAARANSDLAALQAVTAEDVRRVAAQYLRDDRRLTLFYLPGKGPDEPASVSPSPAAPAPRFVGEAPVLAPVAQRQPPPAPGPPLPAVLPLPAERILANGLKVVVARSTDLPILTAELTIRAGATRDPPGLDGAASLTAQVVPDGAPGLTGPEIARRIESLGATLEGSADWDSSSLSLTVLSDRAEPGMTLMSQVAERPTFPAGEVERVRRQSLDGLKVSWQDPGRLAELATAPVIYAGSPYGHLADGSPGSLRRLSAADLLRFHGAWWRPDNAILVLTGDLSAEQGFALAERAFGAWRAPAEPLPPRADPSSPAPARSLAIDLPGAEQAAVVVAHGAIVRSDPRYYAAVVANAILGGGYSARLNAEIRIKRGLSYGAESTLFAHHSAGALTARVETRNETAAEVARLTLAQFHSLVATPAAPDELEARKSFLIGEFGRDLATTDGLAGILADLAVQDIDLGEIAVHAARIEAVAAGEVQSFASEVLARGASSLVVVGDSAKFGVALKALFPDLATIPAGRLDFDRPGLRMP